MICSFCNKRYILGDIWIKPTYPLDSKIPLIVVDLVDMLKISEKFCSKECLIDYLDKKDIDVDIDNLKIDIIKKI